MNTTVFIIKCYNYISSISKFLLDLIIFTLILYVGQTQAFWHAATDVQET